MSRAMRQVVLVVFAVLALGPLARAQTSDDSARYIDTLTRKGYLASIQVAADRSTIVATLGPKMQFLRAADSRREICLQLLSYARATNREIFRAGLLDGDGRRAASCRLDATP